MIDREKKLPRDYEIMDAVLDRGDAVDLARRLSCSPQIVRAWCRPPETEDEYSTGRFGPLARLRTIVSMIREDDGKPDRAYPLGRYIANLLSGVFVPLPTIQAEENADLMQRVACVLKETGEAIDATRKAWFEESPGRITPREEAECLAEIDDAIAALTQLRVLINRKSFN